MRLRFTRRVLLARFEWLASLSGKAHDAGDMYECEIQDARACLAVRYMWRADGQL